MRHALVIEINTDRTASYELVMRLVVLRQLRPPQALTVRTEGLHLWERGWHVHDDPPLRLAVQSPSCVELLENRVLRHRLTKRLEDLTTG
jgi:hypothetical protein